MSVEEIKSEIVKIWDMQPTTELCLMILDYMANVPVDQLEMLTYGTLANATGKKLPDEDLITAVTILASTQVAALDLKLLIVDDGDDEGHEVELVELAEARITGEFYHPDTGLSVPDFEARIVPYFVPSPRFLSR